MFVLGGMCFHLHSTMVSINLSGNRTRGNIPYYLHSTMVSINRKKKAQGKKLEKIYIPLWYLLICRAVYRFLLFLYLHSTMVSINPREIILVRILKAIYIPLWYLLIVQSRKLIFHSLSFTFHYGIY